MRTNKKNRFGLGLLIYILVFILLATAALMVFRQYLAAYEESRVTTALHNYLDHCTDGTLTYQWGTALGKLSADRSEEAVNREWAQDKIRNATLREQITSDSSEKTYGLYDENGFCFSTIILQQTEKGRWGFAGWKVVDERVDLEPYITEVSVEIPSNYLKKGDVLFRIDSRNAQLELESYEANLLAAQAAESSAKLTYESNKNLFEKKIVSEYMLNNSANDYKRAVASTAQAKAAADRARVKDFVDRYLAVYLPFADDLEHRGMGYFDAVYQMIIHGGDIERRIRQAIDGLEYGNVQNGLLFR